ncbi:nucleoside deaminase [Bacillus sp. BRMEA1]|uniref:nucleoside deaminase n=1 Tax=Neobacillus endophyticus TaxID=2738405 RepID=UPI001565E7CB|nr:nucleoside deaminase [Neobacillus endophyticus]NRD77779.1 nucleoside deaminase [Neobacillus endophyticus]
MRNEMYMRMAVDIALENVLTNRGGPFGAVIVRNGHLISIGRNQVTVRNDPTAHAEIEAIRAACKYLNTFQLEDCEIYTSGEPCPMCLGAIYWARLKAIYYASTSKDAAQIGFQDDYIFKQYTLPVEQRSIPMVRIIPDNTYAPFNAWIHQPNKQGY